MQEYEMLLEDVVAQLKAGFAEMERRHQAEVDRLQKEHDEVIAFMHDKHENALNLLQTRYKDEIEQLTSSYNDKLSSFRYELEQKLEAEQQKCLNLQNELSDVQAAKDKAEQLNDYYDERYHEAERITKLIHKLSERMLAGVMAAFGCQTDDDCMKLLFGIVQEKHLDSAWLYMSNAINTGLASMQDREIFNEVMTFAIYSVASVDKTASYEIIMAEPGQSFDSGCMGRATGSTQLGQVQEMLLPGYRYAGSGKVVHPALVLVSK